MTNSFSITFKSSVYAYYIPTAVAQVTSHREPMKNHQNLYVCVKLTLRATFFKENSNPFYYLSAVLSSYMRFHFSL